MGELVNDEILETFAVVGEPQEIPDRVRTRYLGLADRITLYTPFNPGEKDSFWRSLITKLKET